MNKCEELLPIISWEKKRRAEASQKNSYNRFRDKDCVHKHEINAMVKAKIKKFFEKSKKKNKQEINAVDEFVSIKLSDEESVESSSNSNMCLDSDDEWSLGSFDMVFRMRNKKSKSGNEVCTRLDDCINANYNY